jgi:iron-sulfur cluster repair protein YtfE (RIC family)
MTSAHRKIRTTQVIGGSPVTPEDTEAMADVRDMYVAHTMLRREFGLLPSLIRCVPAGDTKRAGALANHADILCRVLHVHHEGEDKLLWPRLIERGGSEAAAIVPTMEQQHGVIERTNHDVANLLAVWRSTAQDNETLAEKFEFLLEALTQHTAAEEDLILPLVEKHITASEWRELGSHGMEQFPKRYLPVAFGMLMYEAERAVIKDMLVPAPLPARLLLPVLAPLFFAAHARRIHGTVTPKRTLT